MIMSVIAEEICHLIYIKKLNLIKEVRPMPQYALS